MLRNTSATLFTAKPLLLVALPPACRMAPRVSRAGIAGNKLHRKTPSRARITFKSSGQAVEATEAPATPMNKQVVALLLVAFAVGVGLGMWWMASTMPAATAGQALTAGTAAAAHAGSAMAAEASSATAAQGAGPVMRCLKAMIGHLKSVTVESTHLDLSIPKIDVVLKGPGLRALVLSLVTIAVVSVASLFKK